MTDAIYMQRCLELAEKGKGNVAPNPMVGAVLVHDDKIIGEGWHREYGKAHAEVNCIHSVFEDNKHLIGLSTLYVSLEPCAHFGKTPPCSDLIIQHKIPKVVIGCSDLFKEVNGKGIERLRNAGIEVVTGLLEKESLELNKRFFTFHLKSRPYIILKWAQSANHMIGSSEGERMMISHEFTNRLVHKWRSEEVAILIGTNTAGKDNPYLSTRLWPGRSPIRLVVDRNLTLSPSLHLFDHSVKTIVFNTIQHEESGNLMLYKIDYKDNFIKGMLNALHQLNIQSVLVEGGQKLLQSFIDAGLWDETRIITNSAMMINNGIHAPILRNGKKIAEEKLLTDDVEFFVNETN